MDQERSGVLPPCHMSGLSCHVSEITPKVKRSPQQMLTNKFVYINSNTLASLTMPSKWKVRIYQNTRAQTKLTEFLFVYLFMQFLYPSGVESRAIYFYREVKGNLSSVLVTTYIINGINLESINMIKRMTLLKNTRRLKISPSIG